ncbi:unnamed protein product [Alopecurus aequalis]
MAQSAENWMMLDRFVYRRDDEETFPDIDSAPLRATSCTSLGQMFEVAFLPADPPAISRFYVRWPGGTKPEEGMGTDIVEANRDLILFRLTSTETMKESPYIRYIQDQFICIASSGPKPHLQLKRLPVCTLPLIIPPNEEEEEERETVLPRVFFPNTVGLVRGLVSEEGKFVVAQLAKVSQMSASPKMEAEICVLRSRVSSDDGDGRWEVTKIPIKHKDTEYSDLWYWSTDAVVTFQKCICWVDYYRGGILFYDALKEQPTISYRRLKINNRPTGSSVCQTLPEMNRSLCVTREADRESHIGRVVLRFVDVVRSDNYMLGPFELGYGFTINSSTLSSADSVWVEDVSIKSQDLWAANTSSGLPHEMLTFPLVNMQNSSIVYFLVSQYVQEKEKEIKKISVVALDVSEKIVLFIFPYITGREDADMIKEKSHLLRSFVSSRFPMYLKPIQAYGRLLKRGAK